MIFQLLPYLIGNLHDHDLLSRDGEVHFVDKGLGELIWRDQSLMQVPQKAILQSVLGREIRRLVRRQVLIYTKVLGISWCRQSCLGSKGRNIQVYPDRDESGGQRGLSVHLLLRQRPLRLAHPLSPDALHIDRRMHLSSSLLLRLLLHICLDIPPLLRRPQACRPSRVVRILNAVIVKLLAVIYGGSASLGRSYGGNG